MILISAMLWFSGFTAALPQQPSMPATIVYFDIAGSRPAELQKFYLDVFGWHADAKGQMNIPVTYPVPAGIRQGSTEKRIYIGVDNITAKLEQIKTHGGTIDAPRFEVKGVVVLALFKDPAGNPMGLVELENGKPKVP